MIQMPRYHVGLWSHHLDMSAAKHGSPLAIICRAIGEYYVWTPDWTKGDPNAPASGPWVTPDSLMYVVMHSAHGTPHPDWHPLPHLLDSTPVIKAWKGVTHPAVQKAIAHGLIAQTDTTFAAVQKLHQQMGVFLP